MIADVLERLDKAKVSAVGLDIVLDRPTEPELDARLAAVMRSVDVPVVIVEDLSDAESEAVCAGRAVQRQSNPQILPIFSAVTGQAHGLICSDTLGNIVRFAPRAAGVESFAEALHRANGGNVAAQPYMASLPYKPAVETAWPFPTYSAAHIDVIPDKWLTGKTVLIGMITPYSGDFFSTPLRFNSALPPTEPKELMPKGVLPGVIVHAFSLLALQKGTSGTTLSWASQIPYALLGALAGVFLVLRRWRLWLTFAAIIAALGVYWWLLFAGFNWSLGTWLPPYCGLALGLILSSGSAFALQEREERARRRMVQDGFSHFLSEDRVQQIINSPSLLKLSAEEREITVLFTDLEGFTKLVDTLPPDQLTPTLNGYLDGIIDVLLKYDGTVDKIVGDAVHAMFSAPLDVEDHKLKALLCALDMQETAEAYQDNVIAQGIALGSTRIGISSGPALVGNFGSSRRFDYTAHGSVVNLAARLEAENKVFGTKICISGTARVETDRIHYREIGVLPVRGIVEPVQLFEPSRFEDHTSEEISQYARAFSLINTDPAASSSLLEELLKQRAGDGLVEYQLARAKQVLAGDT